MLLPVIIDNHCGVKKENLTFPFVSIVVFIACSTLSTGYKDIKNVRILCLIQS